jgi:hypothetical protein
MKTRERITHIDKETMGLARTPSTHQEDLEGMRRLWKAQAARKVPPARDAAQYLAQVKKGIR